MSLAADERWLSAARARAAGGSWERDADAMYAELQAQAGNAPAPEDASLPHCPSCGAHPRLRKFPRHELLSADPFLYCQVCYGFWAVGDALDRGVADPGSIHPALEAASAPRRCKECFGQLKPDSTCAKCGLELALPNCPLCANPMKRVERFGVQLDECRRCNGTWFDTGEIARVFKLVPSQSLAMATVDEHATDNLPPPWLMAAEILARLFIPFL